RGVGRDFSSALFANSDCTLHGCFPRGKAFRTLRHAGRLRGTSHAGNVAVLRVGKKTKPAGGSTAHLATVRAEGALPLDCPLVACFRVNAPPEEGAWLEAADGTRHPIRGSCSLGRAGVNTIVLESPKVSRRHALIHLQNIGELWLIDFGSSNGTF